MYKFFDAHCDTLYELLKHGETLANSGGMVTKKMLFSYGAFVQVFAAWMNTEKGNPLVQALELADVLHAETKRNGLIPIYDGETLSRVFENGQVGAILALEDGRALCGSLHVLRMLYRLGFRLITLTWNGENELGQGAIGSERKGLTAFGKAVVSEMNRLGMVVDVSHLSEKGFWDVLERAEKPIVASHSNAKAVCDHPRNLTDAQIRALIQNGGVIGINFFTEFLTGTGKAGIMDVVRHMEHILSLGGENHLGLGTDFDGITTAPKGLENTGKLHTLFDTLSRIGYSDALLEKIAYKNFVNVFKSCL